MRTVVRLGRPSGARAGGLGPGSSAPPPLICNRVAGCQWQSLGSGCACAQWPQWLQKNKGTSRLRQVRKFTGNTAMDSEAFDISEKLGTRVSYYRPSGADVYVYIVLTAVHNKDEA